MASDNGTLFEPEAIAGRQFPTSFRGFDTQAVRGFLGVLAEEHRGLLARLETAEAAAADVLVAAEARGVEVLREAQDEARRQLAGVAAERDRAVAEGVAEGEAERDAILATAREEADALVSEAKATRQKVLADLTRRRKAARVQVEQLHAAHERLLAALTTVRGAIDTTTAGLREALPEAKAAADAAARRVEAEPDVSVEQLEAEIESLRSAGLTLGATVDVDVDADVDTGEVPVAADDASDRRSSSVRIIRPMRQANAVTGLPEEELQQLDAPDPVEEVRLVSAAELDERPDDAEPEPEPTVGDEVAEIAEAEIEIEVLDAEIEVAEVEIEVEVAEPDPAAEPDGDAERLSADAVDALFARLRSGRAERVAEAEQVLSPEPEEPEPAAVAEELEPVAEEPEPVAEEAEPEPVPEPVVDVTDPVAVRHGGGAEREALLARRDELVAPAQAALAKRLKRVLADEQNELLDALRRLGPAQALPDVDTHADRWAQAAGPDLAVAAAAGSAFLGGEVPVVEPTPGEVAAVAEALAAVVARPLHERLVRIVEAADNDDDAAAAGVRACYRTWRTERLLPAAAHAVLDAFALGVDRALGEGTPVCWIADDGGVPCPDAEDNALAGEVPCGVRFPTGHVRPPAHHGCRCLVTRVST